MSSSHDFDSPAKFHLLSVTEVALMLGMPVSTVYDLVRQGRIGGVVRLGRRIRFEERKLYEWIDAGGQGPTNTSADPGKENRGD